MLRDAFALLSMELALTAESGEGRLSVREAVRLGVEGSLLAPPHCASMATFSSFTGVAKGVCSPLEQASSEAAGLSWAEGVVLLASTWSTLMAGGGGGALVAVLLIVTALPCATFGVLGDEELSFVSVLRDGTVAVAIEGTKT